MAKQLGTGEDQGGGVKEEVDRIPFRMSSKSWQATDPTFFGVLDCEVLPETITPSMLVNSRKWKTISKMIKDIMVKKETNELAQQEISPRVPI